MSKAPKDSTPHPDEAASAMVPRWTGRKFVPVVEDGTTRGLGEIFRWAVTRKKVKWPARVDVQPRKPAQSRLPVGKIAIQWVGQATVLLQLGGINVLTDPIWVERIGPLSLVGPKRVAAPGIRLADLPPIDVVVISHDHADHCCTWTLRQLEAAHQPTYVVPTGVDHWLEQVVRVPPERLVACGWWESRQLLGDLEVIATPARHWSGRGVRRNRTLWCSWVLRSASSGAVYFAGDTGPWPEASSFVGRSHPDLKLAIIPVGSYAPDWFMGSVHQNPRAAVDMFTALGAEYALAIHHSTFQLTDEAIDEPGLRLAANLDAAGISTDRFRILPHGEPWAF